MKKDDSSVIKLLISIIGIFVVMVGIMLLYDTSISSTSSGETTIDSEGNVATDGKGEADTTETIIDAFSILQESDFDMLFASAEYKKCIENSICPTIHIDSDFILTTDIKINQPVNIIFNTDTFNSSSDYRIVIDTEQTAKINIYSNNKDTLSHSLVIEGRSLEVLWNNESAPSIEEVSNYFNVSAYNGTQISGYTEVIPGGYTSASIAGVNYYKSSAMNSEFTGTNIKVIGNTVTVRIPHEVKDSQLSKSYLCFNIENGSYELIGDTDGCLALKFGENDAYINVTDNDGNSRIYKLCVERMSYGIPVVYVTTEAPVTNKTDYVNGCMTIDGVDYTLRIKGRGNSSWTFPKKAYRLKLDEKSKILGMPGDKDWVLVSSYADKSLIRNCVATDMAGVLTNLEYTPQHVLIDLFYNGEYMGVYTLAEKIEEGNKKVNLSSESTSDSGTDESGTDGSTTTDINNMDIGFLIEYGWDFGKENVYGLDYFDTEHTIRLFVKEPEITTAYSPEMKYIMKYMKNVDNLIVNGGNYEDYIDMASWVDWFIIVELANNTEVSFYRSCYLYKKEGGKLYLGPIWDYDMAFGNFLGDIQTYDKWCSGEATYKYTCEKTLMKYLVKDPKFMTAVKARWNEIKEELLQAGLDAVDKYSSMLSGSQVENFKRWDIIKTQVGMGASNYGKYNTYDLQVQYIKEFLNKRYQWIDNELNTKW